MNIYLDIDGVLLANDHNLANYADEFVTYVVSNHTVYWLTTHCQGDANIPINRFGYLFSEQTKMLMKLIKPTKWKSSKTEAIDFSQPFMWFDDDLYEDERIALKSHNALDCWVGIDLARNPDALAEYID